MGGGEGDGGCHFRESCLLSYSESCLTAALTPRGAGLGLSCGIGTHHPHPWNRADSWMLGRRGTNWLMGITPPRIYQGGGPEISYIEG